MRISVNWLKELLPGLNASTKEIAEAFTRSGLEVEAIHDPAAQWKGVITGRVVRVEPHPNADKLRLATVDRGAAGETRVVCGAPNCREGIIVPLAEEGASLPNGVTIRASQIRGVESRGMLCSQAELGASAEKSGLWELPDGTAPGLPLAEVASDGPVLEIGVTPNRGDALSAIGLARDLAAILCLELVEPQFQLMESGTLAKDRIVVKVDDAADCTLYCGRIVAGLKVGPSPFWLSRRLQAHGIRAINNVVDITNYVLLLWGQPLHAFDFDRLPAKDITVRGARPNEKLKTLDGVERTLFEGQLTITSNGEPVALGGVMGGQSTEVTAETANVFIESASFRPGAVRKSSKATGLFSESSYRFERGIDASRTGAALDHAARLMAEIAGGEVVKGRIEVASTEIRPREIELRLDRIPRLLGYDVPRATVADIFRRLGFGVTDSGPVLKVSVLPSRHDLEREIDLIEEIVRIHGYDKVPSTLPSVVQEPGRDHTSWRKTAALRELLAGRGLTECISFTFVSDRWPDRFRLAQNDPRRQPVRLQNAIRSEESVMRTLLVPSLVQIAQANAARGASQLRLFEIGRTYQPVKGESLPSEKHTVAALIQSPEGKTFWEQESGRGETFFDMKAVAQQITGLLQVPLRFDRASSEVFLHPGRSAEITLNASVIGCFGELHPEVAAAYDLKGRVAVLELTLDPLLEIERDYQGVPDLDRFPPVKRDFSFVVPDSISSGRLTGVIEKAGEGLVQEIEVFDLFRGGKLAAGTHSLALAVKLRSRDGTLSEEQVRAVETRILEVLKRDLGVELRH